MQDFLIVGQGVAGSVLGHKLLARGYSLCVIDNGHRTSATKIAAGMVNPVTGKRLTKTPEPVLAAARQYYRELEKLSGETVFHQLPIQRFFRNDEERQRYDKRAADPGYASVIGPPEAPGRYPGIDDAQGSFAIHQGGRVDTGVLLSSMRRLFREAGVLIEEELDYDALTVTSDAVTWRGKRFRKVIFCDGMRVLDNPWFRELRTDPVKGEILHLRFGQNIPPKILSKGKWLLPVDACEARLGATYDRSRFDLEPTAAGKAELMDALRGILPGHDDPAVTGHVAGVRVCTRDSQPLIGAHPLYPSLILFNGFGSKGNSLVPACADTLISAVTGMGELPPELDLLRLWNKPPKSAPPP